MTSQLDKDSNQKLRFILSARHFPWMSPQVRGRRSPGRKCCNILAREFRDGRSGLLLETVGSRRHSSQ